jgi:prepilin-type N-terminal cleavage/methylation domain-containing protein/prepilin-type processing-associated H-X9-DG protein
MSTRISKRFGFTIIELLVVITIIAMLVSMLLPVMSKGRTTAERLICSANQRQLGIGLNTYLNDYKQHFTVMDDLGSNGQGYGLDEWGDTGGCYNYKDVRWFDVMAPYVGWIDPNDDGSQPCMQKRDSSGSNLIWNKALGVMFCPSDRSRRWHVGFRPSSYAVPGVIESVYSNMGQGGDPMTTNTTGQNFTHIGKPDSEAFLGEAGNQSWYHVFHDMVRWNCALEQTPGGFEDVAYDHDNQLNWLFFDGHSKILPDAPHSIDWRNWTQTGAYRNGVTWTDYGINDFLAQFHGGAMP